MESFGKNANNKPFISPLMFLVAPFMPILLKLPLGRIKLMQNLKADLATTGYELLERMRREKAMGNETDRSVIGLLGSSHPLNRLIL